jgi:hypothetical protein
VTASVSVYASSPVPRVQVGVGVFILGLFAASAAATPNKVLVQVGVHTQFSYLCPYLVQAYPSEGMLSGASI